MNRIRRGLWLWIAGGAVLLTSAILVLEGVKATGLLERQAALVFEDSAVREARARLSDLERDLRSREAEALAELARLRVDSSPAEVGRAADLHPLIEAPFLLAADRSLVHPPAPGPSLAALAGDEPAPEAYLHARRRAAGGAPEAEALEALAAVASAPELAVPWRVRARTAAAALHLRGGRPGEAAAAYASITSDFAQELEEIVRPSRAQLSAAHAVALDAAGRREEARAVVLAALGSLMPARIGGGEAAVLLERARGLVSPAERSGFAAELERFDSAHARAARSLRFAREVRGWILSRLEKGGEAARFAEEAPGGREGGKRPEREIVAWRHAPHGSGLLACGFLLRPEAAREVFQSALAQASTEGTDPAPAASSPQLPLRVERGAAREGFHELAALPGPLHEFKVGLPHEDWQRLLGAAHRPFRIAALLFGVLGLVLSLGAALGVLAMRREMQFARMQTVFVANVSHELKTPLALIRLFGETLLFDRLRDPARGREYLEVIVRESERLTHLVSNVLDFAALEGGRKSFDLRPSSLGRVVEETLASYRLQLDERGFSLRTEISPDLPEVLADPEAVSQALLNLLDNAVKYASSRKEISLRAVRGPGSVRISVADRGIGIAPREKRRVFDLFYRSPAALRLGTRGTGLGLSLVKRILEAHGGRVELESALGEGSTFTMVFPEAEGTGGPTAGQPRPLAAGLEGGAS